MTTQELATRILALIAESEQEIEKTDNLMSSNEEYLYLLTCLKETCAHAATQGRMFVLEHYMKLFPDGNYHGLTRQKKEIVVSYDAFKSMMNSIMKEQFNRYDLDTEIFRLLDPEQWEGAILYAPDAYGDNVRYQNSQDNKA